MKLLFVIIGLICLILIYFFIGVILKFLWGWITLIIGLLLGIVIGLFGGWLGAILGLIIFIISFIVTNAWQGTSLYLKIEDVIDKKFYFKD